MHQKMNVLIFFNICPKRANLTILLSSLGLHLSSLLVKCVKDVACKSSHNIFLSKNWAISFVHVQSNLHATCTLCYTISIICNQIHHVYSNSWSLPSMWLRWFEYDMAMIWHMSIQMIWLRYMEWRPSKPNQGHKESISTNNESWKMGRPQQCI